MNPAWVSVACGVLGGLLGGLAAWYGLRETVMINQSKMDQLRKDVDKQSGIELRLSEINEKLGRMDERMKHIESEIDRTVIDMRKPRRGGAD